MSKLTEESLEFAKEHISKYYDSDFFPKPVEFDAIWYNWDEVKKHLLSKHIQELDIVAPNMFSTLKVKGGFRIVHQLDPINAIVYTALAYLIANSIEKVRPPIDEHIACSYRIDLSNGSFFAKGSGYSEFLKKTESLAEKYPYVLMTDITDFYNQIYLHRLNNGISYADKSLEPIAKDIETLISRLNDKNSQGIPVGPAASIIMAEATLIDVDQHITRLKVPHTRYVDDFRIFGTSERELNQVLENLTSYLYSNHRLTLAGDKTKILTSKDFLENQFHNPYVEEKTKILESLEIFNPYKIEDEPDSLEDFDINDYNEEVSLYEAIEKITTFEYLDLGLARNIIRKSKKIKSNILIEKIFEKFLFFAPIINDVILYFDEFADEKFIRTNIDKFEELIDSEVTDIKLVRFWLEWYFAKNKDFLFSKKIQDFIFSSPNLQNQSIAAINLNDLAWIRTKINDFMKNGNWDRRAIINATRILPSDQRKPWLSVLSGNLSFLEKLMAKWVNETS